MSGADRRQRAGDGGGAGAAETELASHTTDEEAQEGIKSVYGLDILQAEDIANAVAYRVTRPERVSVNEILIRPTQQAN